MSLTATHRICLGLALFTAASLAADSAYAYRTYRPSDCSPGRSWGTGSPLPIRVHGPSAAAEVGTDEAAMRDDVQYVIDQFNGLGGVSLELVFSTDTEGAYDHTVYNADGAIQIGFYPPGTAYPDPDEPAPAWANHQALGPCPFTSSNITFHQDTVWGYGTPEDNGAAYPWKQGKIRPRGGLLFRMILMHELGHALGLKHPNDEYALMDHGKKAWSGGDMEYQAEYLPNDRAGFRALYPLPGSVEVDVALTNTWWGHPNAADPAAQQLDNCLPSRYAGTWVSRRNSGFCAPLETDANVICPGDYVQVRYTLNNQGAAVRTVDEYLWFSDDGTLGFFDWMSPDSYTQNLTGAKSRVRSRVYKSPESIAPGMYWPIVQVTHDSTLDRSTANNMIPLNGRLQVLDPTDPRCDAFEPQLSIEHILWGPEESGPSPEYPTGAPDLGMPPQ